MDFKKEVRDLSIAEMLGEVFMPRLEADAYLDDPEYAEEIDQLVRDHQVGGFCIFNATPASTAGSIQRLQTIAKESHGVPLLFSADCEWGLPMRLRNGGTEFPDAMALARANDLEQTRAVGSAIAKEMRSLGLHWNFAPVADINSNPKNPIINTRAFGENAKIVSANVGAYVRGLESEGVAGSVKHFPGHGDTTVDSHRDMPTLAFDRSRFERLEFVPFKEGVAAGVKSIMLAHIAAPQLALALGANTSEMELPSTLSGPIVRILRDEWNYEGILVTDALEMHGLSKYFENDEACLRSFSAGLDVLLLPVDTRSAFQYMLKAIEQGELSEERLITSAARILALKKWVHNDRTPDVGLVIENEDHLELAHDTARKALEVAGDIPTKSFSGVLVFSDARAVAVAKARYLIDRIQSTLPTVILTPETGVTEFRRDVGDDPLIVVLHKARGFIGGMADTSTVPELIREASAQLSDMKDLTVVCFGSPYLDPLFDSMDVSCMIKAFSESTTSIDVVLQTLGGSL